jgi:6-pyruvoyltetrahydropterin/6-carboxytetrahydropterin synthase
MRITVCRKEHFNAAHRLFRHDWSEDKNLEVFGKCSYPHYHGHNYNLIVRLTGEVDPETGYLYDLKKLSDIIKEEVTEPLDHKNLNLDIEAFHHTIPTTENLAHFIWHRLRQRLEPDVELRIQLYETERNFVEYDGR